MAEKNREFIKHLPVELEDEEVQLYGRELSSKLRERDEIDDQESAAKKAAKAAREPIDLRIKALRYMLDTKTETRPVECEEVFDFKGNAVRVYRMDTGDEVDARPMTAEERQRPLPFAKGQD